MEQHFLNTELSEAVYKKYKRHIKAKECYTNTFFVLSKEFSKFKSVEWRVAYGFVSSIDCVIAGTASFWSVMVVSLTPQFGYRFPGRLGRYALPVFRLPFLDFFRFWIIESGQYP